jgi:hypothetical protein
MKRMKVVRITKTEFELEDGTIQPMMFDIDPLPSLEEFQSYLDTATKLAGIEVSDGETDKNI